MGKNRKQSRNNRHEHLRSSVLFTLTLKTKHNREELYPISLSSLISRANVGQDAQIKLIGYQCSVQLATGNHTETVSCSLGHSGPWVRPAIQSDTFNQQFTDILFKNNKVSFNKRLVRNTEREYLNPDDGNNFLVLRVRDPCGVIPGATILVKFDCHLVRSIIDVVLVGAADNAVDLYEDQDVLSGSGPTPPAQLREVPLQIIQSGSTFTTTDTDSPLTYNDKRNPGSPSNYVITLSGSGAINLVGVFTPRAVSASPLQQEYTDNGYDGTIVRNRNTIV